ncbi:MAG TPA: VWA domain-containing protein [Candidatus Binataceae bacterium]|nr:VWA domain-containing protein [Candidatus Binataceae bacterium]
MTSPSAQITNFIAALRAAGIRISVAESIDAMRAVAAAGLEREPMCEALAAALIKDEADRAGFDDAFARFFAAPPNRNSRGDHPDHRGSLESAASGPGRPGEAPRTGAKPREHSPRRASAISEHPDSEPKETQSAEPHRPAQAETRGASGEAENRATGHLDADRAAENREPALVSGGEGTRAARLRALERKPFAAYTDLEYGQARDTLEILKRRFRTRLGRRLRIAKAGRVDIRRTIRAGIQRGGALAELRFRARRPRRIDLTILADISGSVRYAAELMLELVAGAYANFSRVHSFVYIDRLAEADFEAGHLVTSPALDLYARSDFGRVLMELWERRAEVLSRQTVVVILGDGRNNRRPARADLLRELARSCKAIVWLNPEEPARWGTGDSAIAQYAREVRAHLPARDLRELERGLLAIA